MRNMKIAGLIFGNTTADTAAVNARFDGDLTRCTETNRLLSESDKAEIRKNFEAVIPADCETIFTDAVLSEGNVLDLEDADVYIVYPFGGITDLFLAALSSKNRPILIAPRPYCEAWSYGAVFYPYFVRDNRKLSEYLKISEDVHVVKNVEELRALLKAYQVRFRIANTTALCVGEVMYEPYHSWNWGYAMIKAIQQKFGVMWKHISSEKFMKLFENWNGAYEKGSMQREAAADRSHPERNPKNAEKLYYVLKEIIEETGADAMTINCLYSMIHTGIEATACYALSKLNDAGIVATCEADVTTMVDMMITSYASGCPCFMLNPYLFPEDNKLFVSHCSSPTVYSYSQKDAKDPLNLYNYFEIPNLGCGVQVLRKEGETVTVTGISHDKLDRMVVLTGKIVRNTGFASCRTQLELEIDGDVKALAEAYEGRHWALVYGDHSKEIVLANTLLGIESTVLK